MKKSKSYITALICTILLLSVFLLGGCGNSATETPAAEYIVSYQSTDSQVFSSTADVVEAVADTVVEISTESSATQGGQQYIVSGAGSGVVVGSNEDVYYIVTNHHVIDGANDITVKTRSGDTYNAVLIAADDSEDIAVITVETESALDVAVWGDSDDLRAGEDLIAIGNPLGSLGGTVTKGILSATGRSIVVGDFAMTLLQTDTAINPGNSGGGLFNMRGQLVGIVNAKATDEEIEGICFAIPANTARSAYDNLVRYGYIPGRATLGISVAQGSVSSGGINAQAEQIVYVTSETTGDGTTFRQYDRIGTINGKTISTVPEYNTALSEISPNESVTIEVYRGTVTQGWYGNSISFETESTTFTVTALQYGTQA